jgi:hypothetical protein
MHVRFLR